MTLEPRWALRDGAKVSDRVILYDGGTHVCKGPGATGPTLVGIHALAVRQGVWVVGVAQSAFWHRWSPDFETEAGRGTPWLQVASSGSSGSRQGRNYDFAERDVAVGTESVFILALWHG